MWQSLARLCQFAGWSESSNSARVRGTHFSETTSKIDHGALNLFVLGFYGPVNPMGSCRARSVYLTTRLLGRLSPLSG